MTTKSGVRDERERIACVESPGDPGSRDEAGASRVPASTMHVWRFRDDVPVLDFGAYGISTYECERCGHVATSDPFTGAIG